MQSGPHGVLSIAHLAVAPSRKSAVCSMAHRVLKRRVMRDKTATVGTSSPDARELAEETSNETGARAGNVRRAPNKKSTGWRLLGWRLLALSVGGGGLAALIAVLKPTPASEPPACTPGQQVACPARCPNAFQVCSDDGRRWGKCRCESPPTAPSNVQTAPAQTSPAQAAPRPSFTPTSPKPAPIPPRTSVIPLDGCEHRGGTEATRLRGTKLAFNTGCPDHAESFPDACHNACLQDESCMSWQWDAPKPNEAAAHCYMCKECRSTRDSGGDNSWAGVRR